MAHNIQDKNTILTASVAQGYSIPTFSQRFIDVWSGGVQYYAPNPGLRVEKAMVYQLGAKSKLGGLETDLGGFYADVNDAINTVTDGAGVTRYVNFNKIVRQGGEATVKWKFENQMYLFANTLNQLVKDSTINAAVLDWVRITWSAGVGLSGERLRWLLSATYQDRNTSATTNAADRKIVLNANGEYSVTDSWKVFASAYNLGNEDVSTNQLAPAWPPRQVEGGVEWKF
jgi:outer membrane receptor protein involved in Fe transport